jgi:cytochrome P450
VTNPVARVRLPTGEDVYLVTGYDDARTVLSDPRFSRAASAVPGAPTLMPGTQGIQAMFNMDPPDHTRLRSLVSKAFAARRVERLRPRVEEIVTGLLDAMINDGEPADLVTRFAHPLPATVICEMLGIPAGDLPVLYGWAATVIAGDALPREMAEQAAAQGIQYLTDAFEARRRQPRDDLMTALVQVRDQDDRLSQRELLDTVLLLFGTGQETTSHQLALSVLALCQHPDQWARLVEDPGLVPAAVEELLRFVLLIQAPQPRVALEDVVLSTDTIPAGASVFTLSAVANYDPAVFHEPERLDIGRPDVGKHVAFGQGAHFCLGASLARVELQVALTALVTRLPKLRLAVDEADLEWNTDVLNGGLRALPITW